MTKQKTKTGAEPDRVKIDMSWTKAIDKALKKERPKAGWARDNSKNKK